MLVIALCAVLCGADGFNEIEAWAQAKEPWLRERLELPNGIPSHDTFNRVFSRLDPEAFTACFVRWVEALREPTQDQGQAAQSRLGRPLPGTAAQDLDAFPLLLLDRALAKALDGLDAAPVKRLLHQGANIHTRGIELNLEPGSVPFCVRL